MIYPYEHLLIPLLISCIYDGSNPLDLSRNLVYLVPAPSMKYLVDVDLGFLFTALHLQILVDLLRSPWFLVAKLVVLVSVLGYELDELCLFLLHPYLVILSDRLCTGSRVCVLFIWSLLLPWPWHTRPGYFVTHPLHCLAVAWLAAAFICGNLSPLWPAQCWSAYSYLVLSRLWTSTSVLWQFHCPNWTLWYFC